MAKIGIIGGTGIYSPDIFDEHKSVKVHTPFGAPSDKIRLATVKGVEIAFLPRHGSNHSIPPHNVNYRANLWALKELGVERVLSFSAVGSLKEEIAPGYFVIPDQFIDFTKGRASTFYEGGRVAHISVAEPFCSDLRPNLISSLTALGFKFHNAGTSICIEGPRFSTKAESNMWRLVGGDIIGMTLVPEVVLAKELELCYANVSMVTDYDVWKDSVVTLDEVIKTMKDNDSKVKQLLQSVVSKVGNQSNCNCGQALENAVI